MLRAFAVVYLTIIVLVVCDNQYFDFNIHDINALTAFLSLSFLGLAFFLRRKKEIYNGGSILSIALFIFLLYSATSYYFSLNVDLSLYPALKLLSALFLAIALGYFLKDIEILKKSFLVIFFMAGILAASGIIEQFFPLAFPFQTAGIPPSVSFFMNPNFFGGYLQIHVPIGVYLYFRATSLFEKKLLGFGWVCILVSLLFSQSQGGQLAAVLQIILTIRYFVHRKEGHKAKMVGWGALLSVLIYFVICKLILEPNLKLVVGLGEPEVYEDPWILNNVVLRFIYWLGAWRIFAEHWLLGSGLWTFVELYPQTGLERSPPHAHNIYLQTAAETGLIGLGLLLACLATLGATLVRIFKRGSSDVAEIAFYIALSLGGFLLNNISEYNWLTANFIFYFVFLVVSVEVLSRETGDNKKWVFLAGVGQLSSKAVMIIMTLGIFTIFQYYSYQRIISHAIPLSQTLEEWLTNTAKAKSYCNRCAQPHYLSGVANLEAYRLTQNSQYLIEAEQDLNKALGLNPNGMGNYFLLGETKRFQGNIYEARKYYNRAAKDPKYWKAVLGRLAKLEKNKESAARNHH